MKRLAPATGRPAVWSWRRGAWVVGMTALMVWAPVMSARSQSIAFESFEPYAAGSLDGNGGATDGWSGAWNGEANADVVAAALDYSNGTVLVQGGTQAVELVDGSACAGYRALQDTVSHTSGVRYMSFLLRYNGTIGNNQYGYGALDVDTTSSPQMSGGFGGSGGYSFYTRAASGASTFGGPTAASGTVYMLVVRLDGSASGWTNTMIFVNPTNAYAEGAESVFAGAAPGSAWSAALDQFNLRQYLLAAESVHLDEIRIGCGWTDVVPSNAAMTACARPHLFGFNVSETNTTDAALAAGFAVTGLVWDAGSGIVSNPTTPYYFILNPLGAVVVASNTFAFTPTNLGARAAPAPLADTAFPGVAAADLTLGGYTAVVAVLDPVSVSNNAISNFVFQVVDDDGGFPTLSGFTLHGQLIANSADIALTGLVQDVESGIGVDAPIAPMFNLWSPSGARVLSNQVFDTRPASNGDALSAPEPLAHVMPRALFVELGVYTAAVCVTDYDNDRTDDALQAAWDCVFTVVTGTALVVYNDGGASNVQTTAATLNGILFQNGGEDAEVAFYWGPGDGGCSPTAWAFTNRLPGTFGESDLFSTNLNGLTPGSRYYYRAYATNATAQDWADETETFETLPDTLWRYGDLLQLFYVPLPEDYLHRALSEITDFNGSVGDALRSAISLVVGSSNTVVTYDHWEDGYEADIANPVQLTTEVWGDDDPFNGIAPGHPSDRLNPGCVLSLTNDIVVPRDPAIFRFDARDKIAATRAVTAGRAVYVAADTGSYAGPNLGEAFQMYETDAQGYIYRAPLGTNTLPNDELFAFAGLSIMAFDNGTLVEIDRDLDGSAEETFILDEGENAVADYIPEGTRVKVNHPVQVHLVTGDIESPLYTWETRWYSLYPDYQWDATYFSPVGSATGCLSRIYFFNPNTHAMRVFYETRVSTGSVVVAPNTTETYPMPTNSAGLFYTTNGARMIVMQTMDADSPPANNHEYDWGHDVLPLRVLTPVAMAGWCPGSAGLPTNGSPLWVTPETGTVVYADYDGDPSTGSQIDANGDRFDVSNYVGRLEIWRIYDPNDGDQTGMRIYSLDGTGIATAWGLDPNVAGIERPYLDMGYAMLPFPTIVPVKEATLHQDVGGDGHVDPGDQIRFTIKLTRTVHCSQSDVVIYDAGASNATYVPGSVTLNGETVADDAVPPAATAFPLDEDGFSVGAIDVGATSTVTFVAQVDDPFPSNAWAVVNSVRVQQRESTVSLPVAIYSPLYFSKTSSPSTVLTPGDALQYTLAVENTDSFTHTYVRVDDPLPFSTIYRTNSTRVSVTGPFGGWIRDRFSVKAFENSDGEVGWASGWIEEGEDNGPTSNYVKVDGDAGYPERGFVLCVSAGQRGARRAMELSSYTGAVLNLSYRRDGLDASSDYLALEVSTDGGGAWTELDRYAGPATDASYRETNYNLQAYLSTQCLIRLMSSSGLGSADQVYIDDLAVWVSGVNVTNVGGAPPVLVNGYTLPSNGILTIRFEVETSDPALATQIVNEASVFSLQHPQVQKASVTNTVNARPGLAIDIVCHDEEGLDLGGPVAYTITVANTGDLRQTSVRILNNLPEGLWYDTNSAWIASHSVTASAPPRLVHNWTMEPGETIEIVYTGIVDTAQELVNEALVTTAMFPEGLYAVTTNGVDIVVMTQGFCSAECNMGSHLSWMAVTNADGVSKGYDLIYAEAYAFSDALSNDWRLLGAVTNSALVDTGQVTCVPPTQLSGKMRFYRAARHGAWIPERSRRAASAEVYLSTCMARQPGHNWVGFPGVPDTNTVLRLFGTNFPAGVSAADPQATRIRWYAAGEALTVTAEVWLAQGAGWQYAVGGSGSADEHPVPLDQGALVLVPSNHCSGFLFVGRLPAQERAVAIRGGVEQKTFVNLGLPQYTHPSRMNLTNASGYGFQGGDIPSSHDSRRGQKGSDMIFKWDAVNQKIADDAAVWLDREDGIWKLSAFGYPPVPNNYFAPDECFIIVSATNTPSWIWTNRLTYTPPTLKMTP